MPLLSKSQIMLIAAVAGVQGFAEEAAHAVTSSGGVGPFTAPAIAIGIGIAAVGAALGQGKIGAAYMEGVSRNPSAEKSMKTFFILGFALVETMVLFTLLIEFMLLGKI